MTYSFGVVRLPGDPSPALLSITICCRISSRKTRTDGGARTPSRTRSGRVSATNTVIPNSGNTSDSPARLVSTNTVASLQLPVCLPWLAGSNSCSRRSYAAPSGRPPSLPSPPNSDMPHAARRCRSLSRASVPRPPSGPAAGTTICESIASLIADNSAIASTTRSNNAVASPAAIRSSRSRFAESQLARGALAAHPRHSWARVVRLVAS